jgi:glycosyltransferase involved in cell wall biosynthesis
VRVALLSTLDRGGPVEQALLLSGGLVARGVAVRAVCAFPEVAARFAATGADAVLVPNGGPHDVRAAGAMMRAARGCDVVHGHDRRANLWLRIAPRPRRGASRVITVHGLPDPYHPPPIGTETHDLRTRLAYRGLDAGLCRRADAIVAPSRMIAGELVARLGYPAGKLVVVPNGVVPPAFREDRDGAVGMLALLVALKGVDVFLRAAAQLGDRGWPLIVFGDGPERAALLALADELGLGERVAFPGFVGSAQALEQLRVLVIASYAENAPMNLLEAMAAGVAVVTTTVGGIPEIADEQVAQLVAPGDPAAIAAAVDRLMSDDDLRRRQVRAARARVEERFTAAANAEAIHGLYERLLAGGRP